MKVYAPVNIIAPTLYFNGNYQKDSNVIFKVNDSPNNFEMKQSQKIRRDDTNKERLGEYKSTKYI